MIGLTCGIQKEIIQVNIYTKLRQTHIHTKFCPAEAAVIPFCGKSLGRRLEAAIPPRERWRLHDFSELFQPQGPLYFGGTRLVHIHKCKFIH